MSTPALTDAVAEFILATEANGVSPATTRWYRNMLVGLKRLYGDYPVTFVTPHDLRLYIAGLRDRLAADSVVSHVTALHAFWRWAAREYGLSNPMHNIKRPRRPAPVPKAITPADFMRLLNATRDDAVGVRDRALLLFLADTGARLGGVVTLEQDRLFLAERYAVVREKGQRSRRVHFSYLTAGVLNQWLSVRVSHSSHIFTNAFTGKPLTTEGVREILKRLKRKAGTLGRANPHAFRHGFAREYVRAGGDVVTLARLLGHASIETTAAYYAVFADDELAQMHQAHSPLKALLGERSP